ncbi:cryptochrome/photolyase family protein, partial [Microcoleus sp. HI-ES]|nr:cryptochrome/photolyase family protein [Microcoleus sp. HI-ES]
MTVGVWILGDQLWENQAALNRTDDKSSLPIILIESWQHVQQRRYHQQKLVLIWSAMRHFAKELRGGGWQVTYTKAEDFEAPLKAWIQAHNITEVRVMAPNDRPFLQLVQNLQLPCKITLSPNNQFLWTETEFKDWASSRKRLLMEDF